ncbi:hypothetical protein [Mycoplasma suis]|uniref:Uncharacterized protein n=2 Tax=Mycoplasma suis TaxID=57372 RepID=F0QQP1_MYCSL|nr:hypothetical protein [Mycoplasma suis]ADX97811.1 hypothetical protein MSU_0267 [Mycoplasma suis str. Illinois]CBZ40310.1 hypothetical protein MSUIS_02170 [Mycoplasma suis KI3806]
MISLKTFLLTGGGILATGSTVGVGLRFLMNENYSPLVPKINPVNFRDRIGRAQTKEFIPEKTITSKEQIKEVTEDDLDWEYILYYQDNKKKCEFSGNNKERWEKGLEKKCATEWLKEKEKNWNKTNSKSTTELLIRRKKDFVYEHEKTEDEKENPIRWIDYFLDEFKREGISFDFSDASDCNPINQKEKENSKWNEWSCHLPFETNSQ